MLRMTLRKELFKLTSGALIGYSYGGTPGGMKRKQEHPHTEQMQTK
eukprot:gene7697-5399_t